MTDASSSDHSVLVKGGLSLKKNFTWTAIGNVVYAISQWGIISILAKMGTQEMLGIFALALAINEPIVSFCRMQLRSVQVTDVRNLFAFRDYFALRLGTTIIALSAAGVISIMSGYDQDVASVIVLVAVARSLDSIGDIFHGVFQRLERMDLLARATMANGILSFFLFVGFFKFSGLLEWAVVGFVLGSLLSLILFAMPQAIKLLRQENRLETNILGSGHKSIGLFRIAFPLAIVILLVSLTANIPRYSIEHYRGTGDLGIFTALSYLLVAGTIIVGALGQSAGPRLAKLFAAGETQQFWKLAIAMAIGGAALGLAGLLLATLAGRIIVNLLYGPTYTEYITVLQLMTVAGGLAFSASFLEYALTSTRRFAIQVPTSTVVLIITAITSLILVPTWGISGAAVALAVGSLAKVIMIWVILKRIVHTTGTCTQ